MGLWVDGSYCVWFRGCLRGGRGKNRRSFWIGGGGEGGCAEARGPPAGRNRAAVGDGPHRHERVSEWQAGLVADREAQRPAHLRERVGGQDRHAWLERYMEWVGGT